MRRRARLLATAALLTTLVPAVALGPTDVIPVREFHAVRDSLLMAGTTLSEVLNASLGSFRMHMPS
ncbi:hypothetical protein ACIBQ1_40065 [Nonomuraea sp. NPDC050153]|uniref:hypothetical protein n=1 Tax=Nonomuraea sp. NPDC050153 TaxID=3364359 RepID=UPI0037B9082D